MPVVRRLCATICLCLFFSASSLGQQAESTAAGVSSKVAAAQQEPESLADRARKLRKEKPAEVKMSEEEGKELFRSVDKVFAFASEDTGFAKRAPVKKEVVGKPTSRSSPRNGWRARNIRSASGDRN